MANRLIQVDGDDAATFNFPKEFNINLEVNQCVVLSTTNAYLIHAEAMVVHDDMSPPHQPRASKYAIQVSAPKYKAKYRTAAATALFNAYFKALDTALERRYSSLVVPCLTPAHGNYPHVDGAHLQLRVIRRFLEKPGARRVIRQVIVSVDKETHATYRSLWTYYFPQNSMHLAQAERLFLSQPDGLGGPNGEPIIPERTIRITSRPISSNNSSTDSLNGPVNSNKENHCDDDETDSSPLKSEMDSKFESHYDLLTLACRSKFSQVEDDIDRRRQAQRQLMLRKSKVISRSGSKELSPSAIASDQSCRII